MYLWIDPKRSSAADFNYSGRKQEINFSSSFGKTTLEKNIYKTERSSETMEKIILC